MRNLSQQSGLAQAHFAPATPTCQIWAGDSKGTLLEQGGWVDVALFWLASLYHCHSAPELAWFCTTKYGSRSPAPCHCVLRPSPAAL